MKNNIFALFIICLTLLATPAQAALYVNVVTDEFSIESPYPVTSVKACECGTRTEIIEVANVGDFETLFSVQVFSPLIEYMTLSEESFVLAPGEEKQVFLYIKAPCDKTILSNYVVRVATNYGRSKEIYKDFESKKCQNLMFTSKMLNQTVYPGETALMEIEVQNVGDYADNFHIFPTNNEDYAVMSRDVVTLQPDEKTKVLMYITFPIEVFGKIGQDFKVESEKGRNSGAGSHTYEILHDYDFALKTEELDLYVCEDTTTTEAVSIYNLARTPNEYTLDFRGPHFVTLEQDRVALTGMTNTTVDITITPTDLDIGEYELTVSADSKYGDVSKERSVRLFVNNCYDSQATLNGGFGTVTERACCGEKEYMLNFVNKGMYEEAYSVSVDSEGWVDVAPEYQFIRLQPGQQINIPVKATLPCADERKISYVTVTQLRSPHQKHEIALDIESLSQRSCYNVDLVQQSYKINYQTETIPLIVQHTGLEGGNYSLALGELESKFVTLQEESIWLEPGDVQVVHVLPVNYSTYKEGRYLNKLTLNITPMDVDEDIAYERQFWVNLKDKNFLVKFWDYLRSLNYSIIGICGIFTIILLLIAVTGGIAAAKVRSENYKVQRIKVDRIKKLRTFNIILVALLIIVVLLLVFIRPDIDSKLYEEHSNRTGPLFHEWKQNTAYRLNLDQYFADPDDDKLVYTSTQPDHIQVRIDGPTVTLTPEHNWGGEETIVFTARDAKGGEAESEVMTLRVIKKKPLTFLEYWSLYCLQINLALIMILILITLFITDVLEQKGYRKYLPKRNR
jgi:hypothetical protein